MCWKVRRIWFFGREESSLTSNNSMHCPLQRVLYVIPAPTSLQCHINNRYNCVNNPLPSILGVGSECHQLTGLLPSLVKNKNEI